MKSSSKILGSLALVSAAVCTPAMATSSIDYVPAGTYTSGNSFGDGGINATFGQTIHTDAAAYLTSFSLYLTPLDQNFKAYVYAWDDTNLKTTGAAVFESSVLNIGTGGTGLQQVAVNTGSTLLAANTDYVLFFSTSALPYDGTQSTGHFGIVGATIGQDYTGGTYVFSSNVNDFSLLSGNKGWTANGDYDLAFKASFSAVSAVPEPETYAMMIAGLGLVGAMRRRRNTKR